MVDYIRRKDALKAIDDDVMFYDKWNNNESEKPCPVLFAEYVAYRTAKTIENIPAVDLVPKIKGRWIGEEDVHCSNCGKRPHWAQTGQEIAPEYCPNCGAFMWEDLDLEEKS